jgi:hypothetical protein
MLNSVQYTSQEDRIIQNCVEEAIQNDRHLVEGFNNAAETIRTEIGNARSADAIKNRWYKTIRFLEEHDNLKVNIPGKSIYSQKEDEIIAKCVIDAVLKKRQTLSSGVKKAIEVIQEECGVKRIHGGVSGRWYKILTHLPEELQKEYRSVMDDLVERTKPITADDIIKIAKKHSRNPMHVLGVSGKAQQCEGCDKTEITLECALQLAEMKKQLQAQENLIRSLTKQLVSANKYRGTLIDLRYNSVNSFEVVTALMRSPQVLPPIEQKRLLTVMRAGWPQLFENGGVCNEAKPN